MRKYSNLFELLQSLQLNAISYLYSLIENNSVEQSKLLSTVKENNTKESINIQQPEKVVEVTLKAMELNPNHKELQKNSLVILYSEQMLENLSYERYKCTKLVMDSLVNFKETDMNLMASVICSTHLMKLSIKEREVLCANDIYIKTLLNIINLSSNNDLIENTLSALVNLLVDSLNNCSKFLELKGLHVLFSLLEVTLDQFYIKFFYLVFKH
jgi:Zyg-11 family protein